MVEYRWCEFSDADELWIHRLLDYDRGRCLGPESSSCMGLGDRKLRFLDRYWPCRNAHFGDSFLLRQKWRTSVNRTAEAMTIFAVICAGISQAFTWAVSGQRGGFSRCQTPMKLAAVPLPATLGCVCGVYVFHSLTFVLVYGPNSDLATIRDRLRKNAGQCKTGLDKMINKLKQFLYGLFSMGWIGSNRHWRNYEKRTCCLLV